MVIIGIVLSYSIPQYRAIIEQSRVDLAATNLRSIWTAQRLYWTKYRTFASTLKDLENTGLFEPAFISNINKSGSFFYHYIDSADDSGFEALALRRNSTSWNGTLNINEQGALGGRIKGPDNTIIEPIRF